MCKNKNVFFTVLTVLFFCAVGFTTLQSQTETYDGLLGTWDVETESGQYAFEFVFSLVEGKLTGLFSGPSGESEMEDLSFKDGELEFTVQIDAGGQSMAIDFEATIKEEEIEGMLSLEYGESAFSGKKRTKK